MLKLIGFPEAEHKREETRQSPELIVLARSGCHTKWLLYEYILQKSPFGTYVFGN